VAVEDIATFVKEQVSQCYWKYDINCATTVLCILSEIFEIELNNQTFDAALAMHGAGKYGAQCGLVEGTIMFIGVFGRQNNIHDRGTIDACRDFARKFESRFGSLLCSVLRPEGFSDDNPLHMCEQITCEAIECAALHVSRFMRDSISV
jgi:C_GCAxxG_C_C family probable redox protein